MKTHFFGFHGKCVLAGKYDFSGFAENAFWRENVFAVFTRISFSGKCILMRKRIFDFGGKSRFVVLAENVFLCVWRKNAF